MVVSSLTQVSAVCQSHSLPSTAAAAAAAGAPAAAAALLLVSGHCLATVWPDSLATVWPLSGLTA